MRTRAYRLMSLATLLASFTMALQLGGCAQARQGVSAGQREVELWQPQDLCVNANGEAVLACVSIQLNITDNMAYVDIQQLGFDPGQTPYRIYARKYGDATFHMLADNVTKAAGGTVEVVPKSGIFIEEYEEWLIEIGAQFDSYGFPMAAAPMQGIVAARAVIQWPELYETGGAASSVGANLVAPIRLVKR